MLKSNLPIVFLVTLGLVSPRNAARYGLLMLVLGCVLARPLGAHEPLNVLFIVSDDLRPELGIYGSRAQTPHLDTLAASGLTFSRAYCQYSLCNPSRISVMTGRRPETTRVFTDLRTHNRDTLPSVVTLPEHFKNHGYRTQAVGKIFHNNKDDAQSWSVPHQQPTYDYFTGNSWRVQETGNPDEATAERAIKALGEIAAKGEAFFLAVGFIRPHLPFVAPQAYFDRHPLESIELPQNNAPPWDVPSFALNDSGALNSYDDSPGAPDLSEATAKNLTRAYLAAVSFMDAQVGRVLGELDRLGLADSTIVVFWGDHGFHLGEQSVWGKVTNFEVGARVPLVVSVPGQASAGAMTRALVELVDLYPSVCDLAGLALPEGLEGSSFAPLLDNPDRVWKSAAFHQVQTTFGGTPMGYSIRTDRYRYTEWGPRDNIQAFELYDYEVDAEETVNRASDPEYAAVVARLSDQLADG